ncbi:PREDICTED: MBT domain-containing protein 1-like [Priapulus caudatus]|uniref:MBT domain-containing protein 1-like n=1 Tax=Priapulus caudatus TaxID=37621 RepID=A0ABM1DYI3_PRICU|nr:PREDICTED: MBT domain-containing protein 1-like [Priapulus caudatus]
MPMGLQLSTQIANEGCGESLYLDGASDILTHDTSEYICMSESSTRISAPLSNNRKILEGQFAMLACEKCGDSLGKKGSNLGQTKRAFCLSCSCGVGASNDRKAQPTKPRRDARMQVTGRQKISESVKKKHKVEGKDKGKQSLNNMENYTMYKADGFMWDDMLSSPNTEAASVSSFKHVAMSEVWNSMTVGMKVEVENSDCDMTTDAYWIATVMKIAGYKAMLRYEGFGMNASADFWLNLCTTDVHPVGWCAAQGKPLVPPKDVQHKYSDWKDFLVRRLTGARTLPHNFKEKVVESSQSVIKVGQILEVVDKNCISRMRVASVDKVVGGRLQLKYKDSWCAEEEFWCHQESPLIHPIGWSEYVGHSLKASEGYCAKLDSKAIHENKEEVPWEFFEQRAASDVASGFQEGMKLEAIDPLNLSSICVATVMKVLDHGYIMIGIDGSMSPQGTDWFCYSANSPCIFPVGFCDLNRIALTAPRGHRGIFSWFQYLKNTKAVAAPVSLFSKCVPKHGFRVGMKLEVVDLMEPRLICVASIAKVVGRLLKVHFDGWGEEYDQWVDCVSPDIYPVGWCQLNSYRIEGPRIEPEPTQLAKKKAKSKTMIYKGVHRKKRKNKTAAKLKRKTSLTLKRLLVGNNVRVSYAAPSGGAAATIPDERDHSYAPSPAHQVTPPFTDGFPLDVDLDLDDISLVSTTSYASAASPRGGGGGGATASILATTGRAGDTLRHPRESGLMWRSSSGLTVMSTQ